MKIIGWRALLAVVGLLGFVAWNIRPASLDGPTSSDGHTVHIRVSDMQHGPGADLYADVVIRDSSGVVLVEWDDPSGQESWDDVEEMVQSMI